MAVATATHRNTVGDAADVVKIHPLLHEHPDGVGHIRVEASIRWFDSGQGITQVPASTPRHGTDLGDRLVATRDPDRIPALDGVQEWGTAGKTPWQ